ncbi:MAG: diphthamide biosynthesis enzyme Dph2 [Candidatus Aenigmarchaeota archaeon]|nr:diphthamide biosynthesis enzyme Dph2 [Candidatus Aenigmarchaeota archaeon]
MRILIQVPAGLRKQALAYASELEKQGNEVIISAENCFGACDLRDSEALSLGCDKIVHYGHVKFVNSKIPVEFIEYRLPCDSIRLKTILERDWKQIEQFKSFGLVSSLQFLDWLPVLKELLETKGKKVEIGKSEKPYGDKPELHSGQLLGCDGNAGLSVAGKVDCFVSLGSGKFHALAVALETKKPLFLLDIERGEIRSAEAAKELFFKQKAVAVSRAKDSKTFGIVISTKPGQKFFSARDLKSIIEKKGKTAYIFACDELKPEKIEDFPVDCIVNTACPRIAIEDRIQFSKPIINPDELMEALAL